MSQDTVMPPVDAPRRPFGDLQRLAPLRDYMIVACVLVLGVALAFSSSTFLTSTNLLNLLEQSAPIGIVACALTLVTIAGEFDLSAGAIVIVAGIVAGKLEPSLGVWLAPALAVLSAAALGMMNGAIVGYLRTNSFVATLATSLMIAGLGLVITKGFLISVADPRFADLGTGELLGVRYSIWIFALTALTFGFGLAKSRYGRWLFAVGGNVEAARLSGINTRMAKALTFGLSGLAAGVAGVILASRTGTAQAGDGLAMVLAAFAAVVVGGTSVLGGRGAVWRTVLGVLFLAFITNGFNLLNMDPIYEQIVQGAIILLAVAADGLSRRTA
jgi:ribose transport system permease protein